MKIRKPSRRIEALTLIDLLMVIAILMLLAAVLLPWMGRPYRRSSRLGCVNGLKQAALAFRIWSQDNNDRYPMRVSTNEGGTMEFIGDASATYRHYLVMSNELNTPKILCCPEDTSRTPATTFDPIPAGSPLNMIGFTNNSYLSYFVGIDASEAQPTRFLAGDRNITSRAPVVNGILTLTTNAAPQWTDEIHRWQGNVALSDGSVQGISSAGLRQALGETGIWTNRLALP